jgi:hypothetical protein
MLLLDRTEDLLVDHPVMAETEHQLMPLARVCDRDDQVGD